MAKQAVAIDLRTLKTLVMDFLVFKPKFSRRLSRIFFSASSRLSRNFRGRLAGLAQIAAGGWLSQRLRGLPLPHTPPNFVPDRHAERKRWRNREKRISQRAIGLYSSNPPIIFKTQLNHNSWN